MSTGKKSKPPDAHRMGKHTGYDDLGDGRYRLAPMHRDSFADIRNEIEALRLLMDEHNRYLQSAFNALQKRKSRWFDNVIEDLSLPSKETHEVTWNWGEEILTVTPRKQPRPEVASPEDRENP